MDFSYTTKARIDVLELAKVVSELRDQFLATGQEHIKSTERTPDARSKFSQYNNIAKFQERLSSGEIPSVSGIINVLGSAKGNSARVYYKPSITSLAKAFRRCVKPTDENNVFVYFDLRAAEFALNAMFANEVEAVEAYRNGEDIYMHYANLFPEGTERKVIKKILIAQMYNKTAYSTAIDLGCSEGHAQYLLDMVARSIPNMTALKRRIYAYDLKHKGYYAPNGLDQTDLIKVASIDPVKGFSYDFAASCYTQSALGFYMQQAITRLLPKTSGTLLTVFDSMFVEIKPESLDRFKSWALREMAPLIPDEFKIGESMWEAAGYDD